MGSYFGRGASAGGEDEGLFNREDITGASGVGEATGPGAAANEQGTSDSNKPEGQIFHASSGDYQTSSDNPNVVHAIQPTADSMGEIGIDTTGGTSSPVREDDPYTRIIPGSDSVRTGNDFGLPGYENAPDVHTAEGRAAEGEGQGQASPNRNTGNILERDELKNIGSWSTIDNDDSAGSPTGNS